MKMVGCDDVELDEAGRGDEGEPDAAADEGNEYTTPGRMTDGGLMGAVLYGLKAPAWLGECGC